MTRIYFPLRSNAHSLVAGRGTSSVIKRIKIASLLHDEVVLGSGRWMAAAGPYGSQRMIGPADAKARWDTPALRSKALQSAFEMWLPVRNEAGEEERFDQLLRREVPTIAWGATFEPLRRRLRRRHSWIDFADFDLLPDDHLRVTEMVAADVADDHLRRLVGNEVAQRLVAADTAFDFLVASRIEAAVSMDPLHMRVISARIERGEAATATGGDALDILIPDMALLTWDDIADIRRDRDLRSLRSVLADLEARAWDAYERGGSLDAAVNAEYTTLLERGGRHALSFSRTMRAASIAALLSLVTGAIPLLPAAAVALVTELGRELHAARRFEASWLAALMDIRRRTHLNRGESTPDREGGV